MDTLTELAVVKKLEKCAELLKMVTPSFEDSTLGTNMKFWNPIISKSHSNNSYLLLLQLRLEALQVSPHNPVFPLMELDGFSFMQWDRASLHSQLQWKYSNLTQLSELS